MDLALTINGWIDEEVIFAQQLGARQVFAQVDGSQGHSAGWDAQSLAKLANRIQKAGLVLAGLHATAPADGQAAPLAWAARLVQEAGTTGIGLLSLSTTLFPARQSAGKANLALLAPLAETAARSGVKLAVPAVALGISRTAATPQNRLQSLPPFTGLNGTPEQLLAWLEKSAPGSDQRQGILDRLCLVSLDYASRTGSRSGAGLDELLGVTWQLRRAGYTGLIRLGQPSRWKGDTRENHQARAYSTGYLRAVLQAFQKVDTLR
jgi:hypothetical protein